ncbi:MAG: HEAT repeat domain-containing protein [Candidatus Koribacter versatilis]|uniref:HEAT repeat domain-containing protein n=1 Tax=Candidatus Korobacter versatilis TaxID=658062 RepID=A0A932ENC6_9BACT|nr:HEAT repeat domain-containing protein [Candidatus Koribacter versatilis]
MSNSDRDPLFFPPAKQPPEEEPEGYSAEVDAAGQQKRLKVIVVATALMLLCGLLYLKHDTVQAAWADLKARLGLAGEPVVAGPATLSEHEIEGLDQLPPQVQAQRLLERAINHYAGAAEQIEKRVGSWRGNIHEDQRLWALVTTALGSNDLRVRAAAIEVDMAARGTPKTPETVDKMVSEAEPGRADRTGALWALGELANRGFEPDRARQALVSYLNDPQEEARYWAVEGLALTGQDESIAPLLEVLRNDSSPRVRERAACSLAQSGMLDHAQRMKAVPELLNYADDPALDAQTHKWIFQALRDITGQNLGEDAATWRNWYSSQPRG